MQWIYIFYHHVLDTKMSFKLTHWGRVTHICVSKLTIIGSDNGLSPDRHQAIIWTNAGLLLIGPLGTIFSEILIEILTFSLKKIRLKMSSAKCCSFRLGLDVLRNLVKCNHVIPTRLEIESANTGNNICTKTITNGIKLYLYENSHCEIIFHKDTLKRMKYFTDKHTDNDEDNILKEGDDSIVYDNEVCDIFIYMIILQILLPPSWSGLKMLVLNMLSRNTIATQCYNDRRETCWT